MIRVIKVPFVFTNYFQSSVQFSCSVVSDFLQSYLCVNGVTFGKPLWMELVAEGPPLIGGLQLSVETEGAGE